MTDTGEKKKTEREDKIRRDLVQVFFGLVLTQIAVYVSSLVDIFEPKSMNYWAAWSHILLAFFLTTTSWFGWQMSVRKSPLDEEKSIFQAGFVLSLLDIALVTLYFVLVHQVEIEGVAAFPPKEDPTLAAPSGVAETVIVSAVFAIYAVWDGASYLLKEKGYGPWPSVACFLLALLALIPVNFWIKKGTAAPVIVLDGYLSGLVFLFRVLKRLQKWHWQARQIEAREKLPVGIVTGVCVAGAVSLAALVALCFMRQ